MASVRTPQSQQDWRSILKRRSAELAPGGRFVFVNFCESTDGYYLGNTDRGANMYSTFAELWRELVDDGTITEAEFAACTFPNHYKTMAETLAPFEEGDGTFEGLRVVRHPPRGRTHARANPTLGWVTLRVVLK